MSRKEGGDKMMIFILSALLLGAVLTVSHAGEADGICDYTYADPASHPQNGRTASGYSVSAGATVSGPVVNVLALGVVVSTPEGPHFIAFEDMQ